MKPEQDPETFAADVAEFREAHADLALHQELAERKSLRRRKAIARLHDHWGLAYRRIGALVDVSHAAVYRSTRATHGERSTDTDSPPASDEYGQEGARGVGAA